MFGTQSENVIWGAKVADFSNTIIASGVILYNGSRFQVEELGIFEGKAYVRVSPENDELTNILLEQMEQKGNITVDPLTRKLGKSLQMDADRRRTAATRF